MDYDCVCAYLLPPRDPGLDVLQRRAETAGARLVAIPDYGPLDLNTVREMVRLCRTHRVAIWHGHDYKTNALGLVVQWFWPMKLVTTVHGWVQHTWRTPLYYAIDKFCLRHYDEVICVSQDLYEECLRSGCNARSCHWVHNGIDTNEFRRRRTVTEARRAFRQQASRLVIGAMGRLSKEKGFDVLIRAVARLLNEGFDLELWIAGEGDQRKELQALTDKLGISQHVKLLGHVNDTQSFFESLDVFALSSLREGLPNVLLEALALEAPVVATRIAGIPSLIQHGENGLLVEPEDEDALAAALGRLLRCTEARRAYAAAGRRTIEDAFSFEHRMRRIAGIYDALLARDHATDAALVGSR